MTAIEEDDTMVDELISDVGDLDIDAGEDVDGGITLSEETIGSLDSIAVVSVADKQPLAPTLSTDPPLEKRALPDEVAPNTFNVETSVTDAPSSSADRESLENVKAEIKSSTGSTIPALRAATGRDAAKYTEADIAIYKDSIRAANASRGALELRNDRLEAAFAEEKKKNEVLNEALEGYETAMLEMTENSNASVSVAQFVALERLNEQANGDLQSVEQSYAQLHERYERLRVVAVNQKQNEDALVQALAASKDRIAELEEQFDALKAHAEDKILEANMRINEVRTERGEHVAVMKVATSKAQAEAKHALERQAHEIQALTEKHNLQLESLRWENELCNLEKAELQDICEQLMSITGAGGEQ